MFRNKITQVDVNSILIDRANRQRTLITFDSVLQLAVSIGRSQWISPVLVDEETNYLIAGERRLMAVKSLQGAVNGDYSGFSDPDAARITLSPICTCKVDSWYLWTKIPAQLGHSFTATELLMYEFIENAQRQDLPWQDRARAIYDIHTKGVSQDKSWTAVSTATLINVSSATVTENLRIWRVFADDDVTAEVKTIISEAPTLRSALQTVERYNSRRETGPGVSLMSGGAVLKPKTDSPLYDKPGPKPLTDVYKSKNLGETWEEEFDEEPLANEMLFNEDFNVWAANYNGEPFNFIHCDFPYGINFNSGELAKTIGNKALGEYDDSSEVYWNLLDTLKQNASRLIAYQAHVMFWFSQNKRRETEDFFTAMGAVVQPFLLVWHCGENEGIIPDPQRYGRRTYETALLATFGDRKIVAPRALSFAASREAKSRVHRSQKPLRVLSHFFEMFVDNSSHVLDPTAGSGTSLIAASNLAAKRVVGLEIDPDIYENAYNHINNLSTIVL